MKAKLIVREHENLEIRAKDIKANDQFWFDSEIFLTGDSISNLKRQATAILKKYCPDKKFRGWKHNMMRKYDRISNEGGKPSEDWKAAYIHATLMIQYQFQM